MARRFRTISIRNELFLGVCLDRRESRRGCSERLREPVVGRAFCSLQLQDDRMIKTIPLRSDLEPLLLARSIAPVSFGALATISYKTGKRLKPAAAKPLQF